MHREYYDIPDDTINLLKQAKQENRRILAVGTTVARALETASNRLGEIDTPNGWSDIYIYPGYKFNIVKALITNFHLPKSTLLMLVSALAGREFILQAYRQAIEEEYRFFSFGDAMFIRCG